MNDPRSPLFPYMAWAHVEGLRSPHRLSQSGMPAPPADFLAGRAADTAADLEHPCAAAQPAWEARLAARLGVAPERVLATIGASAAMQQVAQALFRPGSRVVTERPSYEPFRALPPLAGAELRVVDRRPEDGWALDVERVAAELAGCGPGAPGHVFVANPHNPTGACLGADELRALAAVARRAGGVLVSNETYMEYLPEERRVHACALEPDAVTIGTLTKAYGLGALRAGWIALGSGLADLRPRLQDACYLGYVDPPTAALRLALDAVEHLPRLHAIYRELRAASRPLLAAWLEDTPEVEGRAPEHGVIAFPRVVGVDDTAALARHLADRHGVDVVPGEYFGRPGHLRVGFGLPPAALVPALESLAAGIRSFRGADPA